MCGCRTRRDPIRSCSSAATGDADFGPAAVFDSGLGRSWLDCRLEWFAAHLCGTGAAQRTRADLFVMGSGAVRRTAAGHLAAGGRWQTFPGWPVPGTLPLRLRLGGELQAESEPLLLADPAHPVPAIGGALTSGQPVFAGGAYDQRELPGFFGSDGSGRPLGDRPDVLSFASRPLQAELTLIGAVRLRLWVRSDAPDCDLAATLIDEHPSNRDYPHGYRLNLCSGIARASARTGTRTLLGPEEIAEITVDLHPTAARLRAGHRIRLEIAGSRFPQFDVNPNTGAPAAAPGPRRIARTRILTSPLHPSHLEVSYVPHHTASAAHPVD